LSTLEWSRIEQSSQQPPSEIQQPPGLTSTNVGGDQTEVIASNPNPSPPRRSKKKRVNSNSPTNYSWVQDHFTKLPPLENRMPKAACNNYKKIIFFCHSKIHVTSNLSQHLSRCPKYPHTVASDLSQTVLAFGPHGNDLTAVS